MSSIQQQQLGRGIVLLCLGSAAAFQPIQPAAAATRTTMQMAAIDPSDVSSLLSNHDAAALLSTMLSTAVAPVKGGGWFAPPDPLLEAGRSVAPTAKALVDLGVTSTTSQPPADLDPSVQKALQIAVSNGWKVMDGSTIKETGASAFPGFAETRGILPGPVKGVPEDSPQTFAAQVEYAARFVNLIDKLPYAAFWYALVEFFIIRPNVDLYKEDVQDDPEGVLTESAIVFGVRFGVFCLIGLLTAAIFS
jgi:hypothetical protein